MDGITSASWVRGMVRVEDQHRRVLAWEGPKNYTLGYHRQPKERATSH